MTPPLSETRKQKIPWSWYRAKGVDSSGRILAPRLHKQKPVASEIKGRLDTGSRAPLRTSALARAPQSPVGTDPRPQNAGWGSVVGFGAGNPGRRRGASPGSTRRLEATEAAGMPSPEPKRLTFRGCGFCPYSWVGHRQQSPGPDRNHIGHNAGSCGRRDAAHPTPDVPERPKW